MPLIALVSGVRIEIYYGDHPPPHIHARFDGQLAQIEIRNANLMRGSLPKPKLRDVLVWAAKREEKLLTAWYACSVGEKPERVP